MGSKEPEGVFRHYFFVVMPLYDVYHVERSDTLRSYCTVVFCSQAVLRRYIKSAISASRPFLKRTHM